MDLFGNSYWDIYDLYQNIISALRQVAHRGVKIESIGISTFGFDFCCVGADGQILAQPQANFDRMTDAQRSIYFNRIPKAVLYKTVATQTRPDATLFQLDAMRHAGNTPLASADKILFLSDALVYMLTGALVTNRSMASHACLVNVNTQALDSAVLMSVGLTSQHFGSLVGQGSVVGTLSPTVQALTGLKDVPIVEVESFNIMSALVGVPATHKGYAVVALDNTSCISLDVEFATTSYALSELDCSIYRDIEDSYSFVKITKGMSLVHNCLREWKEVMSDAGAEKYARTGRITESIFNPTDHIFEHPTSLTDTIKQYCKRTGQRVPENNASVLRCIFTSLATNYVETIYAMAEAAHATPNAYYIVGPGATNSLLCQMLATGMRHPVIACPSEASATGNIIIQAIAAKEVNSIWEARELESKSENIAYYEPGSLQ